MEKNTLKQLQKTEVEILDEVVLFCDKNNIKYSLYGGTLLGAVRHAGFIPWDDDIDIVMTRSEYAKFCDVWKKNPIEGYYLETVENDIYTQNTHAKVRKNGTVLLSDIEDINYGNHGIWIDIFILDKISNDPKVGRKTIRIGKKMILMAKANGRFPGENIRKKIARKVLRIIFPEKKRRIELSRLSDALRKNADSLERNFELRDMCTMYYINLCYPQETGTRYVKIEFEGKEYTVFSNYKEVLRTLYGDYMLLPPEEERVCAHNPSVIEFC